MTPTAVAEWRPSCGCRRYQRPTPHVTVAIKYDNIIFCLAIGAHCDLHRPPAGRSSKIESERLDVNHIINFVVGPIRSPSRRLSYNT